MNIYFKAIVVTLLCGAIFVFAFSKWKEKSDRTIGTERVSQIDRMEAEGVPIIKVKDFYGQDLDLESLKGKVVIINFWASWCAPCLEEVPSLISLVEALKGDLKLVAVSGDSNKEDIEAFLKAFPKVKSENIFIVWDEQGEIAKQYGIDRLPESFIAGPDLKLVKKIIGTINWHTPDSEEYIRGLLKN